MYFSKAQYDILVRLQNEGKMTYSALTMKGYSALAIFALRDKKLIVFSKRPLEGVLEVAITAKGKRVIRELNQLHRKMPNPEGLSFAKRIDKLARCIVL